MATSTQATVVAVFRNASDAQAAEDELLASGFSEEDIYISSADGASTGATGSTETGSYGAEHHEGGITGWFKRIFGQDDESERPYYESAVRSGNVLLSVDAGSENVDSAAEILNRHSPLNVQREGTQSEVGASDTQERFSGAGVPSASATNAPRDQSRAIPVVEEELRVGKRAVLRGGVRVYSRVVEQPVGQTVNLQEERVRVDRQRVNRPVSESDLRTGQDEVIEVQEYAEEPVVSKEARVVEEVRIDKEATQRTQKVKDTVRRTEVNVENLGEQHTRSGSSRDNLDEDFRSNFTSNYGASGETYDTYAPAYRYGYDMAGDPRYQGRNFSDVEQDLRSDYARRYPNSTWEKMKSSIQYGWNKVTGRSSSATTAR